MFSKFSGCRRKARSWVLGTSYPAHPMCGYISTNDGPSTNAALPVVVVGLEVGLLRLRLRLLLLPSLFFEADSEVEDVRLDRREDGDVEEGKEDGEEEDEEGGGEGALSSEVALAPPCGLASTSTRTDLDLLSLDLGWYTSELTKKRLSFSARSMGDRYLKK